MEEWSSFWSTLIKKKGSTKFCLVFLASCGMWTDLCGRYSKALFTKWDGVSHLKESPSVCMHLISICVLVLVVDMEQLHNHLLLCYITRLFFNKCSHLSTRSRCIYSVFKYNTLPNPDPNTGLSLHPIAI